MKCLLKELNMYNYWLNPKLISSDKFKDLCKVKIKKDFTQQWLNAISNQGEGCKLRVYKLFKTIFEREPYLDLINNFQLRKTVTKFRCSDHRLEIEVGRHKGVKSNERICQVCRGCVETETHFLTKCPLYTKLRLNYLGNNVNLTWIETIQCKDKTTAFNQANFLTKAFDLRQRMLDLHAYFN